MTTQDKALLSELLTALKQKDESLYLQVERGCFAENVEELNQTLSLLKKQESADLKDLIALFSSYQNVSSYSNWVKPTEEELTQEYKWEYSKVEGIHGSIFPSESSFLNQAKAGKILLLTSDEASTLENRTLSLDMTDLRDTVMSYSRPRDVDRILKGFKDHSEIPCPVVLNLPSGLWVMGGNTRLDLASIWGIPVKVLVIEAPSMSHSSPFNDEND